MSTTALSPKRKAAINTSKGKKPQHTGKENAIRITARWNDSEKRAIPESIEFVDIDEDTLPNGAHMHLLRNTGKHYFELYNIINDKGEQVNEKGELVYAPVTMPDQKLITPEAFVIPSNMQPYKDYMEYNPPSAFQKIASGVLIVAMLVIGLLMTMTTSKPPGQQANLNQDILLVGEYQITYSNPMEITYDIVWQ